MERDLRDLEQLREVGSDPRTGQRVGMWLLAILCLSGVGLAMRISAASSTTPEARPTDDIFHRSTVPTGSSASRRAAQSAADAPPQIKRTDLTFPEALVRSEERPEVAIALAAATAEIAHLDPVGGEGTAAPSSAADDPAPFAAEPAPIAAVPTPASASLPAAFVALGGPTALMDRAAASSALRQEVRLERGAAQDVPAADTIMRESLREEAPASVAAPGSDGLYTLQVISYQTRAEADAFALLLRRRGHHAFIMAADIPDRGRFYRVRVGPFETQHEAERYRASFETDEQLNPFVVRRPDEAV